MNRDTLIDALRTARELIQRGNTVRWRERYAVLDSLDKAVKHLSEEAPELNAEFFKTAVFTKPGENLIDALPAPSGGPVTAAYGQVWRNGAMVMCEQYDREPCPHQPERRCADCPAHPSAQAEPAPQASAPSECPTHQTTSGDHVICRRCGEAWPAGAERACVRAEKLLRRVTPQAAPAPLPLGSHTAADCSAAFEWLRAEAVKPGADPRAGVALDAWHAAASRVIPQAAPAPQVEPVAWAQLGLRNGHTYVRMHYEGHLYPPPADVQRNLNLVPLYAAPQPAPAVAAPVQPLTIRQLADITAPWSFIRSDHSFGIAQATERACAEAWGVTLADTPAKDGHE